MKLFIFTWLIFYLDPSTAVHCFVAITLYAFLEAFMNGDDELTIS